MGLPDHGSARTWGGRLLVDRDGTEIGTCTQIFVDDATGLPEWAQADLGEGPAVIPLMDATESGDRVQVRVSRAEVAKAPAIDDLGHISPEEEERLYRHYGITFSTEASESVLPVDDPVHVPAHDSVAAEPVPFEPALSAPEVPEAMSSEPDVATSPELDLGGAPEQGSGTRLRALAAGTGGVVAAGAAAVFWWRLRHQVPPTRKELLAARARDAALAVAARSDQIKVAAGPLLQTGRRVSSSAAQQAAVQARIAAERAAVQARAASEQAAAIAAAARTVRLQRVAAEAELPPAPKRRGSSRMLAALQGLTGFAAGYALRARTGGEPAADAGEGQRRQLQQVTGKLQTRAADSLRVGKAQVSQRAGAVAGKVRSRSSGGSDDAAGRGDSGSPAQ